MLERKYEHTDGECFAKVRDGCKVMGKANEACGTYACPFYKAKEHEDYVKLEFSYSVKLLEKDECLWKGVKRCLRKSSARRRWY